MALHTTAAEASRCRGFYVLFVETWQNFLGGGWTNRKASTYTVQNRHKQKANAGFELTIPTSEKIKTVCALNKTASGIGKLQLLWHIFICVDYLYG